MTYQGIQFRQLPLKNTKFGSADIENFTFLTIDRPGCYPFPDLDGIDEEAQELMEWCKKVGFPHTTGNKYEQFALSGASHSAFLLPNRSRRNCEESRRYLRAFGSMIIWFLVADDIFDAWQLEDADFFLNLDIRSLTDIFQAVANILRGNLEDYEKYDNGVIPHYRSLCNALIDVNKLMAQGDAQWEEHSNYLARYIKEYMISNFWRYGETNRDACSEITYLYFRGHYSGVLFIYEMLGLANHGFLCEKMRENLDFNRYLNAAVWSGALVNDVLGVGKEIEDNETENLIIHKILNQKLTLEQAFNDTLRFTNKEVKEAIVHSERLLKAYPEDENLKRYIRGANLALHGHMRWYAYSKRYGQFSATVVSLTGDEMRKLVQKSP